MSYVYDIPDADDLCIVVGDTYVGAQLTLSQSPGVGTFYARLSTASRDFDFDVVANTETEVVISMPDAMTTQLKPGRYVWSLLFRETATGHDRTICHGFAAVVDFPTSTV